MEEQAAPIRVRARVSKHLTYADLALEQSVLQRLIEKGRYTQAAAFKFLVQDRLVNAAHCFEGLNRPLWYETNGRGEKFTIYSYCLPFDVLYNLPTKTVEIVKPPPGAVFMVIVGPSTDVEKDKDMIFGWIKWWNWALKDSNMKCAPLNPKHRFRRTLW